MVGGLATVLVTCLLFYIESRMNKRGREAGSIVGRLGLVVNWGANLLAVVFVILGWIRITNSQGPKLSEPEWFIACLMWAAALIVWLVGKAIRFVLTGPAANHRNDTRVTHRRSSSVPSVPTVAPTRGPWERHN